MHQVASANRSTCLKITRACNSSVKYRHCANIFLRDANTPMLKPFKLNVYQLQTVEDVCMQVMWPLDKFFWPHVKSFNVRHIKFYNIANTKEWPHHITLLHYLEKYFIPMAQYFCTASILCHQLHVYKGFRGNFKVCTCSPFASFTSLCLLHLFWHCDHFGLLDTGTVHHLMASSDSSPSHICITHNSVTSIITFHRTKPCDVPITTMTASEPSISLRCAPIFLPGDDIFYIYRIILRNVLWMQTGKILQASTEAAIIFFTFVQGRLFIADSFSKNCSSVLDKESNNVNIVAWRRTVQRGPECTYTCRIYNDVIKSWTWWNYTVAQPENVP